jgi:hypothetical protein
VPSRGLVKPSHTMTTARDLMTPDAQPVTIGAVVQDVSG